MSTILFVNGHRMLQQAVAVSLFPEHEVRVMETIPEHTAAREFDAMIIEAASADDGDAFMEQSERELPSWNIPVIWIEGPDSSRPPQYDQLIVIKAPIDRSALQAAVAESLSRTDPRGSDRSGGSRERGSPGAAAATMPDGPRRTPGGKKVIDLLDVVEEPDVDPSRPRTKE